MVKGFEKNIDFSDNDDDYISQEAMSIKTIILRHISKISELCCKEFTGGYWNKKPIKTQNGVLYTEVYKEDVREAYCNAVSFLIDLIYPLGDNELRAYFDKSEDIDLEPTDIKLKLRQRKISFKEINKMFERTNFWQATGIGYE